MLKLNEVRVSYGKRTVLWDISLEVPQGEIVSLVGPNAGGKTTLLNAISGLVPLDKGNIEFQGKRIDGLPPQQITSTGIIHVPERQGLFPDLTVKENLLLGAYTRKDKQAIVKDLDSMLQRFPVLSQRKGQLAGTLSGGERQMLTIARGLMGRPKLLLFDEPTLGLAPVIIQVIANIIRDINKDGVTILLVEQNASLALGLANEAYVIEIGRITLHGKAQELAQNENVKRIYLGA